MCSYESHEPEVLYLSKFETYIKIMGEGVEWTQFYFSSTNFKVKLFDEARHHGVDLGKNSLKRPTKLVSKLKIHHQSE